MRSSAAAIAWEFGRRVRGAVIGLAVWMSILVVMRIFRPELARHIDFDDPGAMALFVTVPMTTAFFYFMAFFSFGLTGDLAGRPSIYPTRMFTLPISNAALTGWPMFYGAIAAVLLWSGTRALAIWPSILKIPLIWPAFLAVAILGWTQAMTWLSYPFRGLRVIATVLLLTVIDVVVFTAFELQASETVMVLILAPLIPPAWIVAGIAVRRARRGEIPDWRRAPAPARTKSKQGRQPFASPAEAQEWFEWKRYGRELPALVAMVLPFELALLFLFEDVPVIVFEILGLVLLTPPLLSVFVAATIGKDPQSKEAYRMSAFMATRPMSDAALIAAKFKTALRSTLATWILVLVAIAAALELSGASSVVIGWYVRIRDMIGAPRTIALFLVVLMIFVLATWKQLVQSLFVAMSGREWLVKGSLFLALVLIGVTMPLIYWMFGIRQLIVIVWDAFPWAVATAVGLKLAIAGWIAIRLQATRAISDTALVASAICWSLAVFALYALLKWMTPDVLFRGWFLAALSILIVPLARVAAAPLALAWNRHR
jgi:hypothetical protein